MHYKFTKIFLISLFGPFGFIFLFSILIDPFAIYHTPTIKGFNQNKVDYDNQLRYLKALEIQHKKPKRIILGSSRIKAGINVKDAENQTGHEYYNCGFDGASFDEIYDYAQYSLKTQPGLEEIIIGIDLFAFNKNRPDLFSLDKQMFLKNGYHFRVFFETIFSWTAVLSDWRTLKSNFLSEGFLTYFINIEPYVKEPVEVWELKFLQNMLHNDFNYKNYELDQQKLAKFKELVNFCKQSNIDLKIFMCPVKAMYWEYYYQNGLWPALEQLKRELCTLHPVWDFSGFTPLTTETLKVNDESLYGECSHFTAVSGKLLLKQMFEGPDESDIGCLLTPKTLDSHLTKILEDRKVWLQGPGKDINVDFTYTHNSVSY